MYNIFQTIFNNEIFKSQIFNKDPIESPTGTEPTILRHNHNTNTNTFEGVLKEISLVREFLKNNFGTPPTRPILDIPEQHLLGKNDHIFFIEDINNNIIGCIRYHYLGVFTTYIQPSNIQPSTTPIYCVDCFCIRKDWKRKGVGDYLLTKLHIYVNENNIPYSMFLKEGRNLNIVHTPLYSGVYVYRTLIEHNISSNITSLTPVQAYRLISVFQEINKNIFIICNMDSLNQQWKLYHKDLYKVLVCFQSTFQTFINNRQGDYKDYPIGTKYDKINKIGWITAWLESPNMTDKQREEASIELTNTMYPEFDYIWMNKEWAGNIWDKNNKWNIDGPFHWYSHQWTSAIKIAKSYCILN